MQLQIFDVEHGACALLTSDNDARLMIDCGHNASTGWKPGSYLKQQGISTLETLAITNYDEDHVSGANDLFNNIDVKSIWRNKSVSGSTLQYLKSEDGIGPGIQRLAYEIDNTFTGGPVAPDTVDPLFPNVERAGFYNEYPTFDDENNLSLVAFFKCRGIGVMFTGDLEKAGFKELLKNPSFRTALQETQVYIAPHHGRENGCSDEVAQLLTNVFYVIISDKGYAYETQETLPFYRKIAKGGPFRGETRRVLTTRRDGRIGFNFNPTGWCPY